MSWRRFWLVIGSLLLLNIVITTIIESVTQAPSVTIPYNVFIAQVAAGNVLNITATGDSIVGTTRKAVSAGAGQPSATSFATQRPTFASDNLGASLLKNKVSILAEPPNPPTPLWETLLFSFGPALLFVFGLIYLMRRSAALAGGGPGGILGRFSQSGARLYNPEHPETTFADVAGIDEVKAELVEIVDFLKKPEKYQRLGGTVPKGVLLIGAPGTGKTLLARAVAGEAGVPFFSISASEFIEAIVGVGAARVRDLFQKARSCGPGDRVHRRAGCRRSIAFNGRASWGQRGTGTDPEPDPHRDGRFRSARGCHRARRNQPSRRARYRAAPSRAL